MVKLELTDDQYALLVDTLKRSSTTWHIVAKRGTPEQISKARVRAAALADLIDEVTQ